MARTIDHEETRARLGQVLGEESEAFTRAESRWQHTDDAGRERMITYVASVSNDDLKIEFGADDANVEHGSVDE